MPDYTLSYTGAQIDALLQKVDNFLNNVYPVGAIYISTNSTDPGTLFGGTWTQIQDTFLLAAGSTYTAGATGGSETNSHTHTADHSHDLDNDGYAKLVFHGAGNIRYYELSGKPSWSANYKCGVTGVGAETYSETWGCGLGGSTVSTSLTTSEASNTNNMPPYLAVYMWKRTA